MHHEDIRRAQPGWQPRQLAAGLLRRAVVRRAPAGPAVLAEDPGERRVSAPGLGTVVAGKGGPAVDLVGDPAELILFLMGRQAHARVELTGPEPIIARMRTARFGV